MLAGQDVERLTERLAILRVILENAAQLKGGDSPASLAYSLHWWHCTVTSQQRFEPGTGKWKQSSPDLPLVQVQSSR